MRQWGIIMGLVAVFVVGSSMSKETSSEGWLIEWLRSFWSGKGQLPHSKPPIKTAKNFRVAGDGSCPSFKELKQLKGVRKSKKGLGYSFVVAPSAKLHVGPAKNDRAVIHGRIKAFTKVRLYGAADDRVLIAAKNHILCGWISREALLGTQIKKKDIPKQCGGEQAFDQLAKGRRAMRQGPTQIAGDCLPPKWRKGGSFNSRAIVQFDLLKSRNQKISFYISPGTDDNVRQKRKPDIFEIFAIRQIRKKEAENGIDGTYFLIGSSTVTGKIIHGWMHERDVRIWSNRLAVYWSGTGRGRATLNGKTVLRENSRNVRQGRTILPRFPLLSSGTDDPKLNVMFLARNMSTEITIKQRINRRRVIGYWLMLKDDEWEAFRKTFADACHVFHPDRFDDDTFEVFKKMLIDNAKHNGQCDTVKSCLKFLTFSSSGLMHDWKDVKEDFDDYEDQVIENFHKRFCRTSFLLERIDNNETVGKGTRSTPYDLRRLRWDDDEGRWLVRKRYIRRFDWKHKFPNGMLFYYLPIEFLS